MTCEEYVVDKLNATERKLENAQANMEPIAAKNAELEADILRLLKMLKPVDKEGQVGKYVATESVFFDNERDKMLELKDKYFPNV